MRIRMDLGSSMTLMGATWREADRGIAESTTTGDAQDPPFVLPVPLFRCTTDEDEKALVVDEW